LIGTRPIRYHAPQQHRDQNRPKKQEKPMLEALAAIALLAPAAQDCNPLFTQPDTMAVGTSPQAITTADLDGDGTLDLIVSNFDSHDVSVLLNNADGTFAPQQQYPAADALFGIETADLDGDGDEDVVVASNRFVVGSEDPIAGVVILLNRGDGALSAPRLVPVGSQCVDLAIADFDLDGRPDIAVAAMIDDGPDVANVGVLFNNGDATMSPPLPIHTAAPGLPGDVIAADFDGDGDEDLVITNWNDDSLTTIINRGHRRFRAFDRTTETGHWPHMLAAADFDRDGDVDLAVTNTFDDDVGILLNNGEARFEMIGRYPVGDRCRSISAADFNGDRWSDLAVSNLDDDDISVLLNNADGTFAAQQRYPAGDGPYAVAAAELNGDSAADLACVNVYGHNVDVRFNLCGPFPCNPADLVKPFGVLDFFDVTAFLDALAAHLPEADLDGNGSFDFFDVLAFLDAFLAGCP